MQTSAPARGHETPQRGEGGTFTLVKSPWVMALAHKRSLCVVLGGTSEESDAVSTTVSQQSRAVSARVS